MAWAASSTTRNPCSAANPYSASMSTGRPAKCTGMMARVFEVMAAGTLARSRLRVAKSMSTNTGLARTRATTLALAAQISCQSALESLHLGTARQLTRAEYVGNGRDALGVDGRTRKGKKGL